MKKLLYLFSAVALMLTSCSSDDDNTTVSQNGTLLKKMILTSPDEDDDSYWNSTVNFTYNGNKIVQYVDEDNYKAVFTYTGDLITKIEYFNNNLLDGQDLFSYNSNGKLIEFRDLSMDVNYEIKHVYSYNSNGTITVTKYQGTIGNTTLSSTTPDIYTFTNNEISSTSDGSITYDSKNNPFKNVTGYKEIMTPEFSDDYLIVFGRNNNIISAPVGTSTTQGIFSTYTYNSDNYPISSITNANYTSGFNGTVNVSYFY